MKVLTHKPFGNTHCSAPYLLCHRYSTSDWQGLKYEKNTEGCYRPVEREVRLRILLQWLSIPDTKLHQVLVSRPPLTLYRTVYGETLSFFLNLTTESEDTKKSQKVWNIFTKRLMVSLGVIRFGFLYLCLSCLSLTGYFRVGIYPS